jgi:hypothetical protein
MATTTPNYDWPIPEDTDLVKDGAKAIRDLGNAIDTSAQDFGGGLVHIETQSVTASAGFNFSDNVIDSTYDNYLILGSFAQITTVGNLQMRGRTAGTPYSSANHQEQFHQVNGTSVTAVRGTNQTSWQIVFQAVGRVIFSCYLFNPNFSDQSKSHLTRASVGTNGTSILEQQFSGGINATIAGFDSVGFFSGAGSVTGNFSIYGYRK